MNITINRKEIKSLSPVSLGRQINESYFGELSNIKDPTKPAFLFTLLSLKNGLKRVYMFRFKVARGRGNSVE